MSRRLAILPASVVTIVAGLALAACSTAASPSASSVSSAAPTVSAGPVPADTAAAASVPNPCTLVTTADLSAAGITAGAGTESKAGLYDSCVYGDALVVLVRAIDRATFDTSAPQNPGTAPVNGFAYPAWASSDGFIAWDKGIEITLSTGDTATAEKIVTTAFGRL